MKEEGARVRVGYYVACVLVLGLYRLLSDLQANSATAVPVLVILSVAFVVFAWLRQSLGAGDAAAVALLTIRQRNNFLADFSVYAAVAASLAVLEALLWDAQRYAMLQLVSHCLVIGWFASLDTTMVYSRTWYLQRVVPEPGQFKVFPASRRTSLVLASMVIVVAWLLGLATYRLVILSTETADQFLQAIQVYMVDAGFSLVLVAGLALRVIYTFAGNKRMVIDAQLQILRDIHAGDLSSKTPIMSQDELGLLAMQINRLVDYLREREAQQEVLKRIVSPKIMDKLLNTDMATLKHGEEREVAILFCDIRGFTHLSEITSTEDIILFLNDYFSDLSDVVSRHNGIINKFMGDAILAVYGLEDQEHAVDDAVGTAWEIVEHNQSIMLPDGTHPVAGIGIHYGKVVAGTIGSEQRYEYTFLGDTVNTASRLEGLTKRLGLNVVVSVNAYRKLSKQLRGSMHDLGFHGVRGKSDPVHVFGGGASKKQQDDEPDETPG